MVVCDSASLPLSRETACCSVLCALVILPSALLGLLKTDIILTPVTVCKPTRGSRINELLLEGFLVHFRRKSDSNVKPLRRCAHVRECVHASVKGEGERGICDNDVSWRQGSQQQPRTTNPHEHTSHVSVVRVVVTRNGRTELPSNFLCAFLDFAAVRSEKLVFDPELELVVLARCLLGPVHNPWLKSN